MTITTFKKIISILLIIMISSTVFVTTVFAVEKSKSKNSTYEIIWYKSDGKTLINEALISTLEKKLDNHSRGFVCCPNQKREVYYREEHLYDPPLPAICVYDKYRTTYCGNCELVISDELIGSFSHTHY